MKLLINAPWKKTALSIDDFAELATKFQHQKCWRATKYLGSMMYFDLGSQLMFTGRNGINGKVGSCTISIRDCAWELIKQDELIFSSNQISDLDSDVLHNIFLDAQLVSIEKNDAKKIITLQYNNNYRFSVDITNIHKSEDAILHFVTEDGRMYDVEPNGRLFLASTVSSLRWKTSDN